MKKKIFAAILALALLVCCASTAFAESDTHDWNITFTANNQLQNDYTVSDLSSKVFQMQPGDSVDLTLHLKNDNASSANWYLSNEVVSSLEDSSNAASGGAYTYELTYTAANGDNTVLFTSDTVGGEDKTVEGLHGATEGLDDWLYLDTLAAGAGGTVNLRVALDGETQGNGYQNTLARLQLNFAVDPVTATTRTLTQTVEGAPDPNAGAGGNGGRGTGVGLVNTGDDTNMTPFVLTAGVSGVLLLFLALWGLGERSSQKRRRKANGKAAVRALCLLLAVLVGAGLPLSGGIASAAETETAPTDAAPMADVAPSGEYSYTVRLFPGAKGSIINDGANLDCYIERGNQRLEADGYVDARNGAYVVENLQYGDRINFSPVADVNSGNADGVALNADAAKYYVRGIRASGADNSDAGRLSFAVEGDADYVVAYGIRGNMVNYTVNYLDANGNQLLPSNTYYGNVGDMPVVAYRYVDGYRPQAYNMTKTLSADASENVFNFVYSTLPENVVVNTVVVPGPTPEPAPAPAPTPEPEPEPEPESESESESDVELPDNPTPLVPEPDDLENLDPESTPLGNLGESLTEFIDDYAAPLSDMPVAAKGGLAAAIVALGGVLIFLIVAKKRKKKDAETQK